MTANRDNFIREAWYVAAMDEEVPPDAMLARRILDDPVLLFRDADGAIRAVADICPHRFAPLSKGKLDKGVVTCGYHGLAFDGTGRCVRNPHGRGHIPDGAPLRSYQVHEAAGLIWIWTGRNAPPEGCEPPVPDFLAAAQPAEMARGHRVTQANYTLMVDNIIDLSHSDYLHANVLGTGETVSKLTPTIKATGTGGIHCSWEWGEGQAMGLFAPFLPDNGADARGWLHVDWEAPAHMNIWTGAGANCQPDAEPVWVKFLHSMTPCDRASTHYFFIGIRNFLTDNQELTQASTAVAHEIFGNEDAPMIEAAQQNMGDGEFWALRPWILECDSGAVRVRRMIERRLRDEREEAIAAA